MGVAPGAEVTSAIENGVAEITRRIEFYESDGVTEWYPDDAEQDNQRLAGGSITIDYNSDERRKADLTLRNDDFALRLNPNGGFYYDKIIKLFRGVKYNPNNVTRRLAVVETDYTGNTLINYQRIFAGFGYELVSLTTATTLADVVGYDGVVSIRNLNSTTKAALLQAAYNHGINVFTFGFGNGSAQVPHISATSATTNAVVELQPPSRDFPLKGRVPTTTVTFGGATEPAGTTRVTTLTTAGVILGVNAQQTTTLYVTMGSLRNGAKWVDFHMNANVFLPSTSAQIWLKAALDYVYTGFQTSLTKEWQLGEYMIDGANDQIFPNNIKLTIRDYTKKLIKDKLTFTSTFPAGTSLRTFVRSIAANGGITKFREAIGEEILPNDVTYERDTERWKIIKEVCTAFDYEVFFDAEGYLCIRKFIDPTLAPIFHTFQTGSEGNLVSFDRSLNDSRIYNIINIFGDPTSNDRLPYFGQAINDDPNSPTSTLKLGNRPWTFSANYFSSDEECNELANSRLRIMALESYEINYSSIFYPWMEAGEIIRILDPHRNGTDPTRFLMDQVTMPIDLGPMSGTGKRVTIVGNSG